MVETVISRVAMLEEQYFTAWRERALDPEKPGPNASPSDRELYRRRGKRQPFGLVRESLDFHKLYIDWKVEVNHPLFAAFIKVRKTYGPLDLPELASFCAGLFVLETRIGAPQYGKEYRTNLRIEYAQYLDDIESSDRDIQQRIDTWLKQSEHALARHVRRDFP